MFGRPTYIIPIAVGSIIQIIKIMVDIIVEKKLNLSHPLRSGGFPSVHSGIASSLCIIAGLYLGRESVQFAIVLGFSVLWRYDAMTVRYQAGQHAKQLNDLTIELRDLLKIRENTKMLTERLGHTLIEVLGGIVIGALLTFLMIGIMDPNVAFDYYFTNAGMIPH